MRLQYVNIFLVLAVTDRPLYLSYHIQEYLSQPTDAGLIRILVRYRRKEVLKAAQDILHQRTGRSLLQEINEKSIGPYRSCLAEIVRVISVEESMNECGLALKRQIKFVQDYPEIPVIDESEWIIPNYQLRHHESILTIDELEKIESRIKSFQDDLLNCSKEGEFISFFELFILLNYLKYFTKDIHGKMISAFAYMRKDEAVFFASHFEQVFSKSVLSFLNCDAKFQNLLELIITKSVQIDVDRLIDILVISNFKII